MIHLDAKDQGLLTLLRTNARTSVVELARKLGSSRQTVQNRIRRLELRGVILGYTLIIGNKTEKASVRALMNITTTQQSEASVITALRGNPNIAAVHHTTGKWAIIAEIQTDTLSSFNKIIAVLRLIDGVTSTETNLLLDTYN